MRPEHGARGRPDLATLLDEVLAGRRERIDPRRLPRLGDRAGLSMPRSPVRLWRARAELAQLHRSELARLLREATRLRLEATPTAAAHPVHPALPGGGVPCWRTRCAREFASSRRDHLPLPADVLRLLEICLRVAIGGWPSAAALARASLVLEESLSGRVHLAQGLLAAGRPVPARRLLVECLRQAPAPGLRLTILDGLAWARELERGARFPVEAAWTPGGGR